MKAIFLMILLAIVVALSYMAGMDKGLKAIAPVPVVKTTDEQCVAWLLETNLKDVKKRMCR